MRNILFWFLTATILLAGCSSTIESAGEKESTGEKAPDFSLEDINNRTVRLSNYENKVIILNFFATWCPPCRTEIPDFIELMDEYGDKDFIIIGVSLDKGDIEIVRDFSDEYDINYPILLDDGHVSDAYGPLPGVPISFIIDKKGNIVQKIIGVRSKDYFESVIKPLL